ncbi:MAG TPA: hypothetical protein VGJ06_14040 [Candidatus Acidoferrum sp.]|jgi:hypothetical protein
MPKKTPAIAQAELLLHLYELRREPVMRQARSYVGGPFKPASADEFIDYIKKGDQQTAYILQVFGYWDMLCAFVLHGALTEPLVYDTCQEMYFQYAKIQPYLKTFRREMNLPEWMQNIEKVIERSPKGRRRIAAMQSSAKAFASRASKP